MSKDQESKMAAAGFQGVVDMFDRFMATARAAACFGEPVPVGDRTVIPAAEVMSGAGFGLGYGRDDESGDESGHKGAAGGEDSPKAGGGGGGGGFSRSRPVAVVIVSPDGVTVEPVIDATQIAMAGLAATAFVGYWLLRLGRATEGSRARGEAPSLKSVLGFLKNA